MFLCMASSFSHFLYLDQISLKILTLVCTYLYCSHGGTSCICQLNYLPIPVSAYVCNLDSYDRFRAHYPAFSFSLFIILSNFHNFVPPNHNYVFNIVTPFATSRLLLFNCLFLLFYFSQLSGWCLLNF